MKFLNRRYSVPALVALLITGAVCYAVGLESGSAVVDYVIDGDTVAVTYNGKKEHLRLVGVDTPETNVKVLADRGKSPSEIKRIIPMGTKAKDFVRSILHKGDILRIEEDIETRDRYGRLLGYAWLQDGRMLNELIIAEGMGELFIVPPNVRYAKRLGMAESEAKAANKGLWAEARAPKIPDKTTRTP